MFSKLGVIVICGGFLTCSAFAQTAKEAAAKTLTGFKPVNEYVGNVLADPMELVKKFRHFSLSLEEDSQDITVGWERSRWLDGSVNRVAILNIEATGFADDSVKGERIRHVLAPHEEGGYRVIASGTQFTCWRGANKDKWIDELCP